MSAHRRCESSKHFIAVFTLYSVEDFVHKKVLPDCRMSLLAHIFKSFQCHLNGEATTKSHSNAFITYKKNHSIFWEWWWWKVTLQRKCKKHSYPEILSRKWFLSTKNYQKKENGMVVFTHIYFMSWSVRTFLHSILCFNLRCLFIVDVMAINVSEQILHLAFSNALFKRKCFQTSDCLLSLTSSKPSFDISVGRVVRNPIFKYLLIKGTSYTSEIGSRQLN